MSSQLFISERDIIWPEEEKESDEELDEDGKPKKKKKNKKKKWEIKMYPKHKYNYPSIGQFQRKYLDSAFNDSDTTQTLSYFSRPNKSTATTQMHRTHQER